MRRSKIDQWLDEQQAIIDEWARIGDAEEEAAALVEAQLRGEEYE